MSSSPPIGPKPKGLPSYLVNGTSPLHAPHRNRERENLSSSIQSTYARRQPLDLSSSIANVDNQSSTHLSSGPENAILPGGHSDVTLSEAARDPRDEVAHTASTSSASRPASPYTLNPPIDFDGLSWPSKHALPFCTADSNVIISRYRNA